MRSGREVQVRRDDLLASGTRPRAPSCPEALPDQVRSSVDEDARRNAPLTTNQSKRVAAAGRIDPLPSQSLRCNSIKSRMNRSVETRVLPAAATDSDQSSSVSNSERPLINLSALRRNSLTAFRAETTESDESNQRYEVMMERFQLRFLKPSASFSMGGSQKDLLRGVHTDSFAAQPLASDLDAQTSQKRPRSGSGSGTALLDRELSGSLVAASTNSAEGGEATTLFTRKTSRISSRRSVSVSSGVHGDGNEQLPDRACRTSLNAHTSHQPSTVDEDDHAHAVSKPRQKMLVAVSTISKMLTRPLSPIGTVAAIRYAVLVVAVAVYFVWLPFKVAFVGYSEDTCLD